jgi:hypothetical protein
MNRYAQGKSEVKGLLSRVDVKRTPGPMNYADGSGSRFDGWSAKEKAEFDAGWAAGYDEIMTYREAWRQKEGAK